jgi:hypothetical protein
MPVVYLALLPIYVLCVLSQGLIFKYTENQGNNMYIFLNLTYIYVGKGTFLTIITNTRPEMYEHISKHRIYIIHTILYTRDPGIGL